MHFHIWLLTKIIPQPLVPPLSPGSRGRVPPRHNPLSKSCRERRGLPRSCFSAARSTPARSTRPSPASSPFSGHAPGPPPVAVLRSGPLAAPHVRAAGTAAPQRGRVPPSAEPPPRTRTPVPRAGPPLSALGSAGRRPKAAGERRRPRSGAGAGRGGAVGAGGRALPAALPPAALGGRAVPAAARRLFLLLLISSSSSSSWPLRRGGCGRSGGAMSGAAAAKSEKLDEAQALARSCAGRPDFQPCDGLSLCATHSHGRCFRLHWCCHLGWCHCE